MGWVEELGKVGIRGGAVVRGRLGLGLEWRVNWEEAGIVRGTIMCLWWGALDCKIDV